MSGKGEIDQFRLTFHSDVEGLKLLDEHFLVKVLGKNERIGIAAKIDVKVAETDLSNSISTQPEIAHFRLHSGLDRELVDTHLAIEFQVAGVENERPRGRSSRGELINDPDRNSNLGQPEGEDQTRWPGSNNENLRIGHGKLPLEQGWNILICGRGEGSFAVGADLTQPISDTLDIKTSMKKFLSHLLTHFQEIQPALVCDIRRSATRMFPSIQSRRRKVVAHHYRTATWTS
jgi:hypothetical protein